MDLFGGEHPKKKRRGEKTEKQAVLLSRPSLSAGL